MKSKFCLVFVLFAFLAAAYGQTASEMDELLADGAVSCARAARFVLAGSGILPTNAAEAQAYAAAQETGWLPEGAEAATPLRLDQFSFLVMEAFKVKGGLLYSLFPGPRYAYRELAYRKYIQGRRDPAQTLTGERLVQTLGRVLDAQGGEL